MYISKDVTPVVKLRREIEIKIIKATVKALLKAGFTLSVFDGEEDFLIEENHGSADTKAIYAALYETDEDYLNAWKDGERFGWVRFIYGNDGWDVINDYTVNLEPWIGEGTAVDKLIEKYS
jgi:hypothetical protein